MPPFPNTSISTLGTWPPPTVLTIINCPRAEAVFQVSASAYIAAPASVVWTSLRNTTAFPEWNSFTPSATINSQPFNATLPPEEQDFLNADAKFTYAVVLDPSNVGEDGQPVRTPALEQVSDLSTPDHPSDYVPRDILENDGSFYPELSMVYRIAWITDGDIVAQGLYTERFNEIVDVGEGRGVLYRTWELQCGPLTQ
ncbi:MAG: hypothetical protein Q9192_008878, partial [Flavoplaca navasiana]